MLIRKLWEVHLQVRKKFYPSPVAEMYNVCERYGLVDNLVKWLETGYVPTKVQWNLHGSIPLKGDQSDLQFALFITLSDPNSAFLSHLHDYFVCFWNSGSLGTMITSLPRL